MKEYSCDLYFDMVDMANINELLHIALDNIGFNPCYMSIYYGFNGMVEEVKFDKDLIFSKVNEELQAIKIINKIYDENSADCFVFNLRIDQTYKTVCLTWTNSDMDFLMEGVLDNFLRFKNFKFCDCSDLRDPSRQSQSNIDLFKMYYPNVSFKTKKGEFGDKIVDTSDHWGKLIAELGVIFIAAPMMWFGEGYFDIISRKELTSFKYSSKYKDFDHIVFINLFDLYDNPEKPENRAKQKEFWKYFNLEKRIDNIVKEKNKNFNPEEALQDLIKKMKSRKEKRSNHIHAD